jgi:hypothetical protein
MGAHILIDIAGQTIAVHIDKAPLPILACPGSSLMKYAEMGDTQSMRDDEVTFQIDGTIYLSFQDTNIPVIIVVENLVINARNDKFLLVVLQSILPVLTDDLETGPVHQSPPLMNVIG